MEVSKGICDIAVTVQFLSLEALHWFAVSWSADCNTTANFLKKNRSSVRVRLKQCRHLSNESCVSAHLINFSRLNFWNFEIT